MKNNKLNIHRAVFSALLAGLAGAALWFALSVQANTVEATLPTQAQKTQRADALSGDAAADTRAAQAAASPPARRPTTSASTGLPSPTKQRATLSTAALAELMQRRLTPAMRGEINQHLRPANRAPRAKRSTAGTAAATYVDLSDRSSSVMIAIIDDDNNTVVADITQPIATQQ